MERLRELRVTIEVETNQRGESRPLTLGENESVEEFKQRVCEAIDEATELS